MLSHMCRNSLLWLEMMQNLGMHCNLVDEHPQTFKSHGGGCNGPIRLQEPNCNAEEGTNSQHMCMLTATAHWRLLFQKLFISRVGAVIH